MNSIWADATVSPEEFQLGNIRRATLMSVEAWREPDGLWTWNNAFVLSSMIFVDIDSLTARKLLKFMREEGYLTEASKGKVITDFDSWPYIDILASSNREPLFSLVIYFERQV